MQVMSISRKAQEYGLDRPVNMDSVENYHNILKQANERINAKDSKESDFIRKHLTKLIRVPIGRDITKAIKKAERTGDWEQVLDFVSNDTFTVASNNAMAKKGLEVYRAFRANGVEDPTGVMDGVLKAIAQRATLIKNRHENVDVTKGVPRDTVFENFDSFRSQHPAFGPLEKKNMIADGLSAPLHPGAVKYYKEAGLM